MKRGGKIIVICPHCGNEQQEPDLVKSTYCRKCSGYFTVSRSRAPIPATAPVPAPVPKAAPVPKPLAPTPKIAPKTGFAGLLEGLMGGPKTRIIHCFKCRHESEVSSSAKSTSCSACGAHLDLEDVKINSPFSRELRTGGSLYIGPKGEYASTRGFCGNATILGNLKGSLVCDGKAVMKLKGRVAGNLEARNLIIEKGADVEFTRLLKTERLEVRGKVHARVECSGVIHIAKGGVLEGSIRARGFTVEKGGFFTGDVTIGKVDLQQTELFADSTPNAATAQKPPPPDTLPGLERAFV